MIAPYKVAEVRAQNYKLHFTGELNWTVYKEIVKVILGPTVTEEIMKVPLSKNMVDSKIMEMREDIKHNVIDSLAIVLITAIHMMNYVNLDQWKAGHSRRCGVKWV